MNPYQAGMTRLSATDSDRNLTFGVVVFYPSLGQEQSVSLGPFIADLVGDGTVPNQRFPVIDFSHGGGSSPFVYRDLACGLARRGFVVVMPIHPGNSREDNSLADTVENLERRPRHLSLALTALLASPLFAGKVNEERIAVMGHSMGGYTALAASGAKGWAGIGQPLRTEADPRFRAAILLAPATGWFPMNDSLSSISIPTLLVYAEHDRICRRWQAQLVMDLLPSPLLTTRMIENAGHFSFLSPFPPAMATPTFPPSQDPAGFDRAGFQGELVEMVIKFLT